MAFEFNIMLSKGLSTSKFFVFCFFLFSSYASVILFLNLEGFKKNYFIYLFLAVLGLRWCAQAFSSCREPGLLFIAVRRLLVVVASLVVEHGL